MAVSKQWQLIRSWLRRTYNKEVHEFFRDYPDEDPDNTTPRSTTKAVCLIGANDSQGIATIKRQNFEYLRSKTSRVPQWHDYHDLPESSVQGYPQVQLWFYEKYSTAKARNRKPKPATISFRILDKNWSLTEANAIALKIKNHFATPIYHFQKGEIYAFYYDKSKGYRFKLLVSSMSVAKEVLERTFDVLGDTPNWDFLRKSESEENFNVVTTETVLGKTVRIGPKRPTTEVYFRYAIAVVPPLVGDYPLVDTCGDYWNALYHEPNPYLSSGARPSYLKSRNTPLNP